VEARNCIREALVRDRFGNGMTSDWVECRQIGRDVTSGNGGKQGGISKAVLARRYKQGKIACYGYWNCQYDGRIGLRYESYVASRYKYQL
jgi:hypothetical protein